MKLRRVEYKKYIKLRIVATLIDYSIYVIVFWLYVYCLGTKKNSGEMEVQGLLALPLFIFWFFYALIVSASPALTLFTATFTSPAPLAAALSSACRRSSIRSSASSSPVDNRIRLSATPAAFRL